MALLPAPELPETQRDETCTTRPRLQPIVADVPLTDAERLRMLTDHRLMDGVHSEFLDLRQRDHLTYLAWAIEKGRVSELI